VTSHEQAVSTLADVEAIKLPKPRYFHAVDAFGHWRSNFALLSRPRVAEVVPSDIATVRVDLARHFPHCATDL
jgi:hypothetical protein